MKKQFITITKIIVIFFILINSTSCYKEEVVTKSGITPGEGLEDWTAETHTNEVLPNYDVVFPQDKVNKLEIVINPDDWAAMLNDLTENIGVFGTVGPPAQGGDWSQYTPLFVPASVFFNDIEWYHAGVRFKGNSSLRSSWQSGCMKLAFRFDFDEFEDDYPEIKDQRFYGFQKLSFANNYKDESFLHEKMAADIFRDAGLKAPQTAYYRLYVDYGEGPVYFGLYTAVEIVEDTMLDDQFGSGSGNCYKPEYDAATFAYGTFNTAEFYLKTNEDAPDYSDVEALYNILHSNNRFANVEQWKAELESVFDVDNFLLWLATNTVIQNWDTYGLMSHNYYLYHNPYSDKLVWIPWDNNGALFEGNRTPLSFSMDEVSNEWPLIRYLIDQPEYKSTYESYLQSVIEGAFEPSKIQENYQYYHALIYDYVIGPDGEQSGYTFLGSDSEFTDALTYQLEHVAKRHDDVLNYLSTK
jgi:spore coat protein CotH